MVGKGSNFPLCAVTEWYFNFSSAMSDNGICYATKILRSHHTNSFAHIIIKFNLVIITDISF